MKTFRFILIIVLTAISYLAIADTPDAPIVSGTTSPTIDATPTWNWTGDATNGSGNFRYGFTDGSDWIAEDVTDVEYTPVSSLAEGTYTLYVQERDAGTNWSLSGSYTIVIDVTAPSGYTVAIDQSPIYSGNDDAVSFTFADAEVGTTYNYTISSSGGGADVTGSGTISTATDKISGIDVSGLGDGTLTLSVALTDAAGNTGGAATDTETKDAIPPSAPSTPDLDSGSDTGDSDDDNITSDDTPTFTGAAGSVEASATVTVISSVDGALGTTTAAGDGSWSYTPGSAISAGDHTITATARDAAGNTSGVSTGLSITIDKTSSTVSSVTVPANNTYYLNDNMDFYVNYNEAVYVTGTPYITIDFNGGNTDLITSYVSGSGTSSLLFRYVVQLNDDDNNGIGVDNIINLNSGTIKDVAGNNASLNLVNIGNTSNVLVDATQPYVLSVSVPTNGYYVQGNTLSFTVQFNKAITVTGAPYIPITLETGGPINAAYLSGSGSQNIVFRGTVISGNLDLNGITLGTNIELNGGTLKYHTNSANTTLNNIAPTTGVLVDAVAPTVSSVDIPADGYYVADDDLAFTVNWNEIVNVSGGTPYITVTLNTGGSVSATYKSGSGSTALVFSYKVQSGNLDLDGITVGTSINLNGATIKDDATNDAVLTYSSLATSGVLVDAVKPTLSNIHIESGNINNTEYAKNGDNIFVTFTSSENLNIVASDIIIQGIAATSLTGGPTSWTASRTINSVDDGEITFSIDNYEDLAGNSGGKKESTDDLSKVTYYNTLPTLTTVTITSNSLHNDKARVGSIVTLNFSSARELDNIVVSIAGHSVIASPVGDNYNWTAQHTMQLSDIEGTIPFTIDFTDMPENVGTRVTELTFGGTNVTFDKTDPELNAVTITSDNTPHPEMVGNGGVVTLSITGSENIVVTSVTIADNTGDVSINGTGKNWTATYTMDADTYDNGVVTFSISYKDLAENAGEDVTAITHGSNVTFDKIPPAAVNIMIDSDYPNEKTVAKVGDVVTVVFTADNSENIENVVVKINGKNAVVTDITDYTWTTQYTMSSTDSENSGDPLPFTISFSDYAGNAGSYNSTSATHSGSVTFDKTPPALSNVSIASNNATSGLAKPIDLITLTFTSSEVVTITSASIAGNAVTPISDGGAGLVWTATYTMQSTDNNGTVSFLINYADAAGNPGATVTTTTDATAVVFDKTAPSKPGTPDMDNASDTGISNTDNITSVVRPTFSGSAEPDCTISLYSSEQVLSQTTTSDANGDWSLILTADLTEVTHGITITATDAAGNVSVASNPLSVTIDKTAPDAPQSLDLDAASDTGISDTDNITSDNTPTINGNAEVGSTVKLYNGATQLGSAVTDGTGNWSITSSTLADNTYSLTATATDVAGNVSTASAAIEVTIDTQAPAKPSTPDLTPVSDTGASNTDNVTSITNPAFLITAEAGSTVKLLSNVQGEIGSGVTDGTGTWALTASTALSEGNHSITATATDVAGNVSLVSSALSITIDKTPPAAPITPDLDPASDSGTSDSDNYTNVVRPTFTGTAETYATVEIFSDAVKVGEGTANIFGIWSITITSDLTDGARVITAKATDAAGNVSEASASLTITIDTQEPETPAALVLDDASNTGSTADNITADTTPTFTGTAEEDAIVKLRVDGVEKGSIIAAGGTWSITTTTLTDGGKSVTLTATDLAGNVSDESAAYNVEIDATIPAAPSKPDMTDASDTGTSNTDNATSVPIPVFSGTAEKGAIISLYSNVNGSIGSATADGTTGEWTITATALAEGNHSITATATDAAANVSTVSTALLITIDITDPAAPVITGITEDTGASNSDGVTKDNTPTVQGTSEANALIRIFVDGALTGETNANSVGVWSYTLATLADEDYVITAMAIDAAGNESDVSSGYNIKIDTATPNAPSITGITDDTGRDNADGITSDQNLIINGTSEVNAFIDVYIGGALVGSTTADGGGDWNFDHSSTTLAAGSKTLTARATDNAGNISVVSADYAVVVDITAPNAPVVTSILDDTGLSASDGITTDQTLTVNGISEPNALVDINIDGTYISTVLSTGTGSWTYDHSSTPLSEGSHTISATATDVAGNVSSTSTNYSVVIDKTSPTVVLSDNHSDAIVRHGDMVTITATFAEGAGIDEVNKPQITIGALVTDAEMTMVSNLIWRYVWTVPAGAEINGDVTVSVSATDVAGNANTPATGKTSYTVDSTQPTVALTDNHPDAIVKGGETVEITATFSEMVTTPRITIGNLVLAQDMSGAGSVWTYAWTVPADHNGAVNVSVSATDVAGNASAAVTTGVDGTTSYTVDNIKPTVVLTDDHADAIVKDGDVITITATFTEANGITEATLPQITIGMNTFEMLRSTNLVWTYEWTVSEAADGPIAVSIAASDVAGNASATATGKTAYTVDNTNPTVTLSDNHADAIVRHGDMVTITATFTEANGIDEANMPRITIGTLVEDAEMTMASNLIWRYIWVVPAGTENDGDVNVIITATDVAGNANTPATGKTSYTVDNTQPTVVLADNHDDAIVRGGETVEITATFSEMVNTPKITIGGLVLSQDMSGAGSVWKYVWTVPADHNGTVSVSVSATDIAGNACTAATGKTSYTVDNVEPTVVLSDSHADAIVKNGEVITISATFTEANGMVEDTKPQITIGSNTHEMIKSTNLVWTYEWTVSEASDGLIAVSITASDVAGNVSATATGKIAYTVDNTMPALTSVSILSNYSNPDKAKAGSVITVNFTSSETIQSVTATILGNVANVSNVGGNMWKVTYTVIGDETAEGVDKVVDFQIDYEDVAGNAVGATSSDISDGSSVTLDITKPVLSPVTIFSDHTPHPEKARIGSLVTVEFTSDEPIEGVSATINSVNASVESVLGETNKWRAFYYMRSVDIHNTNVAFTINYKDLAGNSGLQQTAVTDASLVAFDKVKPTFSQVRIYSNNTTSTAYAVNGNTVFIEFTTIEDAEIPSVTINGVDAASITGGSTSWVASRELIAGENEGVIPFTIDVIDLAGNESLTRYTTTDASSVTFDDQEPSITAISVASGVYKVGDIVSVFIQADNNSYVGVTVEVNGKGQTLENNNNNTYSISYLVEEEDNDVINSASLPVNIVLRDNAGNIATRTAAVTTSGKITVDANTPQIQSVTSTAEDIGSLLVGDQIIFTVSPAVAEEGLLINPSTYNTKPISWSTTDGGINYTATYTVQEGDPTREAPLQLGSVTITDQAGNISSSYSYTQIEKSIYATSPTALIKGTTTKCDYGQLVPVRFEFTGYAPFQLQYSDGVDVFDVADIDDYFYEIQVERGTYSLVKLTDAKGNITTSALQNAVITVNPLPSITLSILGSPFNVNEERILLTDFATPSGGNFSGEGVTTIGYFYPNMVELEGNEKNVPITYTYTDGNGCTNSATQNVVVSTGGAYIEGFTVSSVYCQYNEPFVVEGKNPNSIIGWFSLAGADQGWVDNGDNTLTLSPGFLKAGDYSLKYRYEDGGTTFEASKTFTIDSVGSQIDFGQLLDQYCADAGVVSLQATGLFPLGGTGYFNGPTPGFNPATAVFEPSKVSKFDETYTITYHYITPLGCSSDTIRKNVRVNALPVINFTLRDNYNSDEDPVTLSGVPGGSFSDNQGIIVNNILYPSRTTPGFINVTLNYTQDVTGCSNTLTKQTRIRKATETIQGLENVYCYSNDTLDISTQVVDDPTIVGQFYSAKGAIVSTGVNSARYSIVDAGNGTDVITFRYNVGSTPYEISKTVLIDSIGPVTITNLLEDYCADAMPISISGYLDNPPQGSRTISYSGTIAAFDVASGGIATLSPSLENPGDYAVTFKFTSAQSGCSRDTTYSLTIHPLPVVVVDFPEYYSIDAEPLVLEGSPVGGTFSALKGVSGNEFLPALAGPGLMTITYRVQDVHGCVNTAQDGVTVVGADAVISGLPAFTCIDSQPFTITGSSNNGLAGEFVGKGIRDKQENSAVFDPIQAGKGVHTITYKYLFEGDGTTELFITRNIEVDSLGVVEFFELDNQYCFNNAGRRISALPVGGTFKVENYLINNVFNPSNARTDTLNPITYTLTNPLSGCSITGIKDVVVNPVPNINFFLDDPCSDLSSEPVRFKNTTTSVDPVVEWMWRFETNGSITSGEFEPSYIYSTSGSKEVTLMAKTDKDCSIERTSIVYVGLIPKATFSWRNECLTGEETVFTSTSDPTNLVRYRWLFDNETILEGGVDHRSVNHTFAQVGNHNVEMVIESGDGCLDTIQKQVLIQPYIQLADLPNMVYFDNFEGEEVTWDARPIVENQFSSWLFGPPNGAVINTAASGVNAWYTQVDNQQIERSQVLSPCFDLRSLEKPMLKFNLWSSSYQGRDGAVLQYDLDGKDEWAVLGEIDDGINWYNNTIESLPGDQLLGWSHTSMTDWVSARISLDEIKDASNVRFRIAYATNKFFNPTPYDGIAFDDFWIGNREQNLLLEYFTNATLAELAQPNTGMYDLEQHNALDVVPVHYHTSRPSGDPMHSLFPSGIASRQFFYGVSAIPYALVNGLQPFGFSTFGENQTTVNVEQLKDPEMMISVSGSAGTSISLSVDVTSLVPIVDQELVLYAIIVQKEYATQDLINGQSIFYNVVRGIIPDPVGTKLASSWGAGQMETIHITGQLPSGVSNAELRAVVFVQNIQTRRVYQVGVVDVGSITSVGRLDEPFAVNLFPNPATTLVRLVSPQVVEHAILLDVSGRTIRVINPNSLQFEIPVGDLKPGLYIIRFKSSSGYSTAKFIKQ